MALDPRPRGAASRPPPMEAGNGSSPHRTGDGRECPKCDTFVSAGTKFCGACGHRMPAEAQAFDVETRVGPLRGGPAIGTPTGLATKDPSGKSGRSTLFFGGAVQSARAKLTLIRGDGEDGVSFTLAGQEHPAGRGECPISFPDDPFLSPTHANFLYRKNGNANDLVVRDEGSLNGIFVRISGGANLVSGATVLIGEQVLTVSNAPQPEDLPDTEGTYYSASMPRPASLEVRQHLRGGAIGYVFRIEAESVVVGREGNDINFPEDPFISGRHAEIRTSAGMLSVTDLGSRNGTFVRVNGEQVLRHGDYVFLGQQLLRVEIV
ncbi:MAG: FHA domain-containing protein [Deltaproteobacteria bacterium]|nr:FHA domain-containing protein [Deltaproteobacteria bacterium]